MRVAENPNERDTLGPEALDGGSLEMGTVGWDDGNYLDAGTTGNDGNTLVAVQLYRGRDQATALQAGVAQGHKIWCQVSSLCGFTIPLQGTRVLVAIPAGMRETQGAPLIVGAYQTGVAMHGNLQPGETVVGAMSGQARTIYKANGVAVTYTTADNTATGASVSFYVGFDKFQFSSPNGGITVDSTGVTLTVGKAALQLVKATGDALLTGKRAAVTGSVAAISGAVMTMIGKLATQLTAAAIVPPNPTSGPLTGIGSATVFISP